MFKSNVVQGDRCDPSDETAEHNSGTIKMPLCSKAVIAKNRPYCCSPFANYQNTKPE